MAIRFDNIELNYIKNLQEETVITINANQSVLFQSDVTASSGNITAGAVGKASDTVMRVLAGDSNKAGFEAYGNSQGTGYLYVGQSSTYGGGISYNGDNSPSFISGESSDRITFFRRNAGTSSEVFSYSYISDSVYFNGDVTAATGFRTLSGQAIDFVDTNIGYNSIKRDTTNGGLVFNTGGTASLNIFDNGNATFAGDVTVNGGDLTITSASTNSVINLNGGDSFVEKDSGTDLYIANNVSDRDIKFRVKDNGTNVIALTLDGSENGNATFSGDVTVTGDLIVNGTQTILNTQTVEVEDNIIQLNTTQGSPDTATATTSGISIYRGSGVTQASFIFDDADDTWDLTNNLRVAGNLIVNGNSTGIHVDSVTHASINLDRASTSYDNNLIYRTNGVIKWRLWQDGSDDFLYIRDEANTSNIVSFQTGGTTTFAGDVTIGTNDFTAGTATIGGILLEDSSDRGGLLEINRKGTSSWSGTQIKHGSELWSLMGNDVNFGIFDDVRAHWIMLHSENDTTTFRYRNSTKLTIVDSGIQATGSIYINDTNTRLSETTGNALRVTTDSGWGEFGPQNTGWCHLQTDRPGFYFNKGITVDTGTIQSYNENLVLKQRQSTEGALVLEEGIFRSQEIDNSINRIGGFVAQTGLEDTYHFYTPGISPNELAGANRRLTVTATKNGSSLTVSDVPFYADENAWNISTANTDVIIVEIAGVSLNYGQYYGVSFGASQWRAKDIEIEVSTDNGSTYTSIYNETNMPYAVMSAYHGGTGTIVNKVRYTLTNFNTTSTRINHFFAYKYLEDHTSYLDKHKDESIYAQLNWKDGYPATFGNSGDLVIKHSGSDSIIETHATLSTGDLYIKSQGSGHDLYLIAEDDIYIRPKNGENGIIVNSDGAVDLYHNNGLRFQTATNGVRVPDNYDIQVWNSNATSSTGQINLARSGAITFYGDAGTNHSITSRDANFNAADDLRINTYGAVYINLDSNNNNTSNADFRIGRHGGTSTISDWLFKVDGETGNVGIGTTLPAEKLHINGGSVLIQGGTSTSSESKLGFTNAFDTAFIKSKYTNPSATTETYLAFHANTSGATNGTVAEQMRIAGSRVGIGTTSPNHKLDIYSNENVPLRIHRPSNANLNSSGAWGIGFSTRSDAVNSTTDTRAGIFSYYNGNLFFATNTSSIVADPDASARMTILSNGNVGIGETNPGYRLDVHNGTVGAGIARFSGADSDDMIIVTEDGYMAIDTRNAATGLSFQMQGADKVRILPSGNVGIGTDSPTTPLQISTTTNVITPLLTLHNSTSTNGSTAGASIDFVASSNVAATGARIVSTRVADGAHMDLRFHTQRDQFAMIIDTSGNVGIGTTSPVDNYASGITPETTKLAVHGGTSSGYTEVAHFAAGSDTDDTGATVRIGHVGNDRGMFIKAGRGTNDQAKALLGVRKSNNTDETILTIQQGGNVGIGTTSPAQKLQVASPSATSVVLGASYLSTNNNNFFEAGINANDGYINLRNSGVQTTIHIDSDGDTFFNGGDVGIGTTSPSYKLHVEGNSYINATSNSANLTLGRYSGQSTIKAGTDDGGYLIMDSSGGRAALNWYSGDHVVLANGGGNVGIKTVSPSVKLHISGNSAVNDTSTQSLIRLERPFNSGISFAQGADIAIGRGNTYPSTQMRFILDNGSNSPANPQSTIMALDSSGNVGIGTTDPDASLHISDAANSSTTTFSANGRIKMTGDGVLDWGSSAQFGQLTWDTNKAIVRAKSGTALHLGAAGNANHMVIDTLGRVTIGTTSSNGSRFHVHQSANLGGTSGNTLLLRSLQNTGGSGGNNVYVQEWAKRDATGTTWTTWRYHNAIYVDASYQTPGTNTRTFWERDPHSQFQYFGSSANYTLTIDGANHRVGIGNTLPSEKLEITGHLKLTNNGNFIKMVRNSGSAVINVMGFSSGSDTLEIKGGSTGGTAIKFKDTSGDIMVIHNSNVGIGTTAPAYKLDVDAAFNDGIYLRCSGTGDAEWLFSSSGTNNFYIKDINQNAERLRINTSGYLGVLETNPQYELDVNGDIHASGDVIAFSDISLKENIKTIDNSLEKVNKLRGVEFNKIGSDKKSIGVIAQEIEKVLPEVVKENDEGIKSVAYGNITGILIEAIKELKQEIETLKTQINN